MSTHTLEHYNYLVGVHMGRSVETVADPFGRR
jgi:hypothetical protein